MVERRRPTHPPSAAAAHTNSAAKREENQGQFRSPPTPALPLSESASRKKEKWLQSHEAKEGFLSLPSIHTQRSFFPLPLLRSKLDIKCCCSFFQRRCRFCQLLQQQQLESRAGVSAVGTRTCIYRALKILLPPLVVCTGLACERCGRETKALLSAREPPVATGERERV